MSIVRILPYLRKGLAKEITGQPEGIRASFSVKADLVGTVAGSEENAEEVSVKTEEQRFALAGPVDVKSVEAVAISEVVPADKSEGYSMEFMPYIEFYEEDFPWRYTPLAASGTLKPWLLLLACKDDEFTLTKDNKGYRRVTVDPKGEGFYPKVEEFYKLAHVQVTMPDWTSDDVDPAAYVNENPDDGISRLFCFRPLEAGTRYTMFLVPAFELGRRAGMGESLEGARLDQLAWNDQSSKLSFPVYYQWSFKTGGESFLTLAQKQTFISDEEFKALPDGLKLDIQETGLKEYRSYTETINEDKVLVDMPAALVKHGFDESKLTEEVPKLKMMSRSGQNPTHMTDELKNLQLMSPVFNQNADDLNDGKTDFSEQEDPWVVPPVYGARHVLATKEDFKNEKLFLNKLNLRFRNRAAAGLGVSVVKRNQEVFTNRAWGMIDEINALNQRIREYYEACQTNGASSKKATSLQNYVFRPHASGLQADAAIRVANAQSGAKINAVDLAMDIANPLSGLSVRSSVLQPLQRGTGITVEELDVISNRKYWKEHWAEIVQKSAGYRFLTGKKEKTSRQDPFFDGDIDERFNFLRSMVSVAYPTITLNGKDHSINGIKDASEGELLHFKSNYILDCFPARSPYMGIKDYMDVLEYLYDESIVLFDESKSWYIPWIDSLVALLKWAEDEDYNKRWGKNDGTKIEQRSLPLRTFVMDGDETVGYALFLKDYADDPLVSDYPKGFYFQVDDAPLGKTKIFILPRDLFKSVQKAEVVYNRQGHAIKLVADPEKEGRFIPESEDLSPTTVYLSDDYQTRGSFLCGVRNHMVKDSYYHRFLSILEEQYADSQQKILCWKNDQVPLYSGSQKVGEIYSIYIEWGTNGAINIKADYIYDKRKKTWYHLHHGFAVPINSEYIVHTKFENCVIVDMAKLMVKVKELKTRLEWFDDIFWSPNYAYLNASTINSVPEVTADKIGKVWGEGGKKEQMEKYFDTVVGKDAGEGKKLEESEKGSVRRFREHFIAAGILSDPDAEPQPEITSEDVSEEPPKLIDADEENRKRLLELANTFAERGMTLDLSISNFDGKYPIMAYPIFPDPTSFYLRELSERFILPSVDKLKLNSISCFVTNPIFEEAFLAGMNTEMGRELLWREYPTDERGSYFRKFWDQVELPNDFSDKYFDVKFLHNWNKRLGANHEDGKGQLVVFVIKSELMMQYPQTGITLSTPKNGILEVVLVPEMTGWLADDTYMAGFDISTLSSTKDLYLTFTETDKSQRFNKIPLSNKEADQDKSGDLSSVFAVKHKNGGTVWGCGVKSDYLVVNDLHLDDESTTTSGLGTGTVIKPKPNGRLDPQNPDLRDVRPELKR